MSQLLSEDKCGVIRTTVAKLDRGILDLPKQTSLEAYQTAAGVLKSDWAELVDQLSLGDAPEMRTCPVCQHSGRRDAKRCGFCWTELAKLPLASAASPNKA